jgi:hypothetical protein
MTRSMTVLCSLWIAATGCIFAEASTRPAAVVTHLEQTVEWYHFVISVADATATDVLQRDSVRQQALDAIRLAFESAHAEAALFASEPVAGNATPNTSPPKVQNQNLQQAANRANHRVNAIQARIEETGAMLQKAPARTRATLLAKRNELKAELALAKQVESTIQKLVQFAGVQESGAGPAGTLTAEINQLERSVPEVMPHQPAPSARAPAAHTAASAVARPFHPESDGIFALFGETFTLTRGRSQLTAAIRRTDELIQSTDRLRSPLVNELKQEISQSQSLASAAASSDVQQLAAGQREIETLSTRFKQLSTAAVPLGEQGMVVASTRGSLVQMRNALTDQYGVIGRYLLLRLGILVAAIGAVWVISELWRRAIFRYILDARRRRQFLVFRRVIVAAAIAVVIILGFVSEFGSLATYAGLLTAGIAVALQNVILAVVAYFFLIGRHGLRIGDRVTISGVTGNVVDIGLVRIYLMELAGAGPELHPTGRVVVFSNSVVLQPSALYKQMPGTDYVWHTVKVVLTADSDFQTAQKALYSAVDAVYQGYRKSIEQQHAAFERSVDVQFAPPKPESQLRFTEEGLEVVVHYPIPLQNLHETDERVMKTLYDTITRERKLQLVSSGAPQLITA